MKVLKLNFELQPIEGVDALQVAYYCDNGWFVNFFKGKDALGSPKQYTIFNGFVIFGGFGLLSVMPKLQPCDYLFPEISGDGLSHVLFEIRKWKIEDYEKFVGEAQHEHPMVIST